MLSPYERMAELAAARRRFALATVVRTHGSTPQVVGAKLVVTDAEDERPFGTLGGGCVEADAILSARGVLASGDRSLREYQLTEDLAWNTGLVCGGTMWILAERGDTALRCGGHDVLEAGSGREALELAREHEGEIDVLVSDVVMPGMSGPSLARELVEMRPRLRVLFLSGHADDRVLNIDDPPFEWTFLQKPVTTAELDDKLREVIG